MLEAALVLSSLLYSDPSLFIFFPGVGSSALLHAPLATQTVGGDDDFMSTFNCNQHIGNDVLGLTYYGKKYPECSVYPHVSILLQVKPKSPCVYIKSDCVGGF